MRKLLTFLIALGAVVEVTASSLAQMSMTGAGSTKLSVAPTCAPGTQATNFLARTSGLNATETYAYCIMINGLVSDGIITGTMNGPNSGSGACGSLLDALYILATNNTTTAALNLCGTSYSLVANNAPTFVADTGYNGNGTSSYLDTAFNPSTAVTPNFVQNSASFGFYNRTSSTSSTAAVNFGGKGSSDQNYFQPLSAASTFNGEITGNTFSLTGSNANRQGAYTLTRTGSGSTVVYKNGSTTLGTGTSASTTVPSLKFFILAMGSASIGSNFSTDQISAAFIGGALTSTQAFAINNRINAYMAALGVNIY